MSDTKIRKISIEEHRDGNRLALTEANKTTIHRMLELSEKIARYADNSRLQLSSDNASRFTETVAILYGLIPQDVVSDNAEPETGDPTVTEALTEQSPPTEATPK